MSKPQIRSSQLITTFGPGAMVDLPADAVIVGGIESWRYHRNQPLPVVSESRLQAKVGALLGVPQIGFRKPPAALEDRGFTPDITGYRFPEWFIVQNVIETNKGRRSRRLVHLNDLEGQKYRDIDGRRYPVVPVRFVRACRRGHVGDIDWHAFVHGAEHAHTDCTRELVIEERGTSGDLDSIWIRCACGEERPMSQAARWDLGALGRCNGSRPWLGPGNREGCGEQNRLLIRSASNAYFPQLLSVISIPDVTDEVDRAVEVLWESHLSAVENENDLHLFMRTPLVHQQLENIPIDKIMAAIQRKRGGGHADERPVKEVEFEALSDSKEELGADEPDGDFFARCLPREAWAVSWLDCLDRIVLVHRLREVVAQIGFTRFEAAVPDIQGELDINVQRAPIGLDISWVPAIENRGEGIFLQFKSDAIKNWLDNASVKERDAQLQSGFDLWQHDHEGSHRQYPGLPFYMLHSLSHLLLTAISLDCGYPASSLRERVYAALGNYGVLIYTGSSDVEGTLGGLVEEGRRIQQHLRRALEMGSLCSNDPVCAFHRPRPQAQQPLLGSACHGCLLISETSCEQHNDFLDRSLVVSTIEQLGTEFFGDWA